MIRNELSQHRDEHINRVCRLPFLVRQTPPAKRVIRAVHLRTTVDQEERGPGHVGELGAAGLYGGSERTHPPKDIIRVDAFVGCDRARRGRLHCRMQCRRIEEAIRVRRGAVPLARWVGHVERECIRAGTRRAARHRPERQSARPF